MLDMLRMRILQGRQNIKNIRTAAIRGGQRSFPVIDNSRCVAGCAGCARVCPTAAIAENPLAIDLGRCISCGVCEKACDKNAIVFKNYVRVSASSRDALKVSATTAYPDYCKTAVRASSEMKKIFGRSLKLRQVSAGGCNACELELGACSNVNFDMGRFGIEFVASPRHADGIVVTGPVTKNMARALDDTWRSIAEPKIIIAVGACAVSGGLFAVAGEIDRRFFDEHPVELFVPGCPPHPLTFINGILDLLGRK